MRAWSESELDALARMHARYWDELKKDPDAYAKRMAEFKTRYDACTYAHDNRAGWCSKCGWSPRAFESAGSLAPQENDAAGRMAPMELGEK